MNSGIDTSGASTNDHRSKFALEGFTESVAKEVGEMAGVNFLLVEPNGMHTKFAESALTKTYRHPAYDKAGSPLNSLIAYIADPESWKSWSDPDLCATVLFNCVIGQNERSMPTRLFMGRGTTELIRSDIEKTLEDMDAWGAEAVQCAPGGPPILPFATIRETVRGIP